MGGEILPKRSSDRYQRLVIITGIYLLYYSVRNILDKLERFQTIFIHCLMIGKKILP